jgi:outer membrane protein OmpA-like peptidoglycan-associated protein
MRTVARLFALLSLLPALSTISSPANAEMPDPTRATLATLEKIEQSDALGLQTWIEGSVANQVRVGERMDFHFQSNQDVYLTTLYIDANGAMTILHGGDPSHRIHAGQVTSFPTPDSGQSLVAEAPLGRETVFAIATLEPLPREMFAHNEQKRLVTLERPEDARHFAQRLADYLSVLPEGSVDVASFSQEIIAASTPQRYASSQIVEHFTTQTRSLRRPKLDLDIQFEFGSDRLTPAARQDLDELGRALEHPALKNRHFELSGHTDDVGSAAYNMELSKKRAKSARNYLMSRYDIEPEAIRSAGYGEGRPIVQGDSDEARRRNRRVVIEQLP